MLTLGFSRRIFLRRGATDMRKSFDSLAGLVRSEFAADPLSGDAFVFGKRSAPIRRSPALRSPSGSRSPSRRG